MSLRGEPLFEGLNFKELFGKELVVDKVFWSYDGISLLCVCKDEDEKLYFCNCTEVRSEERWVLYPASKQQIEQIVSKSKTPAEVFRDSRVVYMYTIGLDTDQGTLRELTADELPDAEGFRTESMCDEQAQTRCRPHSPRRSWLLRININHKLIDQNHKSGIM